MSKRTADFQLTSENCNIEEKQLGEVDSKECKEDDSIENESEISSRKMVRIKKKYDLHHISQSQVNTCKVPTNNSEIKELKNNDERIKSNKEEIQDVKNKTKDQSELIKSTNEIDSEKKEQAEIECTSKTDDSIRKSDNDKSSDDIAEKDETLESNSKDIKKLDDNILPFGNTGLNNGFKNPFVSLAKNEGSFLFSGFNMNVETKIEPNGEEYNAKLNEDIVDEVEGDTNEEEPTKKAFTGEEDEETIYQCKDIDLFVLKTLENEQRSFKKLGTGIIHLNIPKKDDKNTNSHEEVDLNKKNTNKPRIIFRQKGIYKVLLNSPLTDEITKTFQKNSAVRKGYAINFVAFNEESKIIHCMVRFQNEADLLEFMDKLNQINKEDYECK